MDLQLVATVQRDKFLNVFQWFYIPLFTLFSLAYYLRLTRLNNVKPYLAPAQGFEPQLIVLETIVLPITPSRYMKGLTTPLFSFMEFSPVINCVF